MTLVTGVLQQIGSANLNLDAAAPLAKVDAIQIAGQPELRNVIVVRYLLDHISRGLGSTISLAMVKNVIVGARVSDHTYSDSGMTTMINVIGLSRLLLMLVALFFAFMFVVWGNKYIPLLFVFGWIVFSYTRTKSSIDSAIAELR